MSALEKLLSFVVALAVLWPIDSACARSAEAHVILCVQLMVVTACTRFPERVLFGKNDKSATHLSKISMPVVRF